MALVKVCDYAKCKKELGGEQTFIQIQGTISDQHEPHNDEVSFRYLTRSPREVHTFCDEVCEKGWRDEQREKRPFEMRLSYEA